MTDQPTLVKAMGNRIISDEEVAAYNEAQVRAGITTPARAAMFAAQLGHESAGLQYYEELASGDAYEWRQDLGNIQPGDGRRFKGRGPIQVTGRRNYTVLSQWAYDHGYTSSPDTFVRAPELLAEVRYGFLGAVWYWTTQRPLNALSDAGDLEGATRAINGGLNGITDRAQRYMRCVALGSALLPEGDEMAGEAQDIQKELKGPDGRGWPVVVYDKAEGVKKTLVAMVGDIYTKVISALPVGDKNNPRPRPLSEPDDLFGHILSLRAQVDQVLKNQEAGK